MVEMTNDIETAVMVDEIKNRQNIGENALRSPSGYLSLSLEEREELKKLIRIEEELISGSKNFWDYCRLKNPEFYRDDRPHLRRLCDTLQSFYERRLLKEDGTPYEKLMINMPPQFGKTRTLTGFCQWILGRKQTERIIVCSYNDDTAGDFSKFARDGVTEVRHTETGYVFSDFFPNIKMKYGSQSYFKWALEGQHFNYLGAGIGGSITSKGGTLRIIDDPVKGATEAFNENHLDSVWQWYVGTFLSRSDSETGGHPLDIITMTRWAAKDPCGRILDSPDAKNWYQIKLEACNEETGKMLCASMLDKSAYETLKTIQQPEIFWANYQQQAIEIRGLLYKTLKTYDKIPKEFSMVKNYTDTADQGDDYLCSINYGVYKGEVYILDVLYTKDGMEVTEPLTAKFLFDGKVNLAKVESNNGGRGFARNVERILWETFKSRKTVVKWFHQSENKDARIMANSAFAQEHVYFPMNWKDRFPQFYKAITTYLKESKNKNDDAPDCLTGVVEDVSNVGGLHSTADRLVA